MEKEILELMKTRRSIRAFSADPIDREKLLELAEAACWAPTGSNIQPWCFGIVDDAEIIKKIKMFSPGLFGDPAAIFVMCADEELAMKRAGETGRDVLSRMDVMLASENLVLAAHAMGLGTCLIRSFNPPGVASLLNIPQHLRIEVLISVGRPAKMPDPPKRRPMDEVTFINEWGGK